jgi:hypothetical protein
MNKRIINAIHRVVAPEYRDGYGYWAKGYTDVDVMTRPDGDLDVTVETRSVSYKGRGKLTHVRGNTFKYSELREHLNEVARSEIESFNA